MGGGKEGGQHGDRACGHTQPGVGPQNAPEHTGLGTVFSPCFLAAERQGSRRMSQTLHALICRTMAEAS